MHLHSERTPDMRKDKQHLRRLKLDWYLLQADGTGPV